LLALGCSSAEPSAVEAAEEAAVAPPEELADEALAESEVAAAEAPADPRIGGAAPIADGWGAPSPARERSARRGRPPAASPAARIAPAPIPQNAVLSSTFVGGSGASARL